MSERVTNGTGAAVAQPVRESCPGVRESPEQLVVLVGLTALVLALAAWAHALS
jgi:hypothetical protein